MSEVNGKRLAFVEAYVMNGNNIRQAAMVAGYAPKSAHVTGNRLLKDANVLKLITQMQVKIAEKHEITYDTIIQEHAGIGFAKAKGQPTFKDKRGSLDSMAKMAGLITDKHTVTHELTFEGFREEWGEVIDHADELALIKDK